MDTVVVPDEAVLPEAAAGVAAVASDALDRPDRPERSDAPDAPDVEAMVVAAVNTAKRIVTSVAQQHCALATGLVWALVMLVRLYAGGAIGFADNFDGHRLLCQLGVAPHPLPVTQALWAYTTPRYDSYTWYGEACSAGGSGQGYLSTEIVPLWAAKWLTGLFGLPGALDLRMLGIVFTAVFAAGIAWTVHELVGPKWLRILIASGIGLATCDSAIAPYFNSPFSEPAALIGMLLLIPALLRLLGQARYRGADILIVTVLTAWTIGAKTQMASLLIVVVPILLMRPSASRDRLAAAGNRVGSALAVRGPAMAACAVLSFGTLSFQQVQPRWFHEIVVYDAVFRELLGHSPNPKADLRALGLDESLASAAGTSIVDPKSAANLPDYPQFVAKASLGKVLGFYVGHPVRLLGVADRGLIGVTATRPSYLGNYPITAGKPPYAQECRVCVSSAVFTLAEPFRWVVIPGLWGAGLVGGVFLFRRRTLSVAARGVGVTLAAFAAATVAQFWAVMLSEGESDLEKHMVFVLYGTMLLGPLLLAGLAALDSTAVDSTAVDPEAGEMR
ncbi:hypothetical protein ABH920_001606 [Catenulispora sp. EB89]|uniref:glycan biosynthesis hexose transferase WsfD n=1 Tax=Catenulispora sp. EB89 TaxID=3156257 RepID=UPI003514AA4C